MCSDRPQLGSGHIHRLSTTSFGSPRILDWFSTNSRRNSTTFSPPGATQGARLRKPCRPNDDGSVFTGVRFAVLIVAGIIAAAAVIFAAGATIFSAPLH